MGLWLLLSKTDSIQRSNSVQPPPNDFFLGYSLYYTVHLLSLKIFKSLQIFFITMVTVLRRAGDTIRDNRH